jgi:hypothetical protein
MDTAEAYAHQAAEIFTRYASSLDLAISWKTIGEACLYHGKQQEAYQYLTMALETVRRHHNLYREIEILLYLVEYDFMSGNHPQAIARLSEIELLMGGKAGVTQYCSLQPLLLKCQRLLSSIPTS